VNKRSSY